MEGAGQRGVGEPNKQLRPTPQSAARFGVPRLPMVASARLNCGLVMVNAA
jgi:hypothetical protein